MNRKLLKTSFLKVALIVLSAVLMNTAVLAADDWVTPLTVDGQPDLQGMWTNPTLTPMERPRSQAEQAFLTIDQITAIETRTAERRIAADNNIVVEAGGSIGAYNQVWMDSGDKVLSTGQTSLIVDPPTGRAPIRESATAVRDYNFAHVEDSYIHHTVWDRCISRGVPGSMLPAGYNNAYRIVQSPDYITIIYEMIHDVRIIPLAKTEHLDSRIKLWMGDSVAHWEGETLVIETTNYNDRGMIASSGAGGRLKGVPVTEDLHVVERFTRISEETIMWEARVTDPTIYTQPFTISMPLTGDQNYDMYEYACHEGNHAIANILSAGRASE